MASLNGRLFLSWHGFDNNKLSVAYSLDDGRSFGNKFISTEASTDSPALCAHGNSLFAAWKGVDNTPYSALQHVADPNLFLVSAIMSL